MRHVSKKAGRNTLLAFLCSCCLISNALAEPDIEQMLSNIPIEDEATQADDLRQWRQDPISPQETVWQSIRDGFAMKSLPQELIEPEIKAYTRHLGYTHQMAFRSRMYLYYVVSEARRRNMPTEIALLPFVESAYQPEALSSSQAAGLWQFIPSTGDIFDLRQSSWRDDRLDVLESTRAALDYLQSLYEQFGDWHLALAAYNCGQGTLRRAIARNEKQGLPTDFVHLKLPTETRRYVPKLLAIKALVEEPERYHLRLPGIANEPYFVEVTKNRDLDIETAAQLAETDLDEFKLLNPGFNRPVILAAHERPILIPADKADVFVSNLLEWQNTGKPLSSWGTYRLKPGESLHSVAKRFGMSAEDLLAANKIPRGRHVKPGSTLLVKDRRQSGNISAQAAKSQMHLIPLPKKRLVTYRVRANDSLSTIARRFGTTVSDIKRRNHLKSDYIFKGQRLRLLVIDRRTRKIPRSYIVKSGDTLYTISQKFHISVSELRDLNDLESLHLHPGQKLRIRQ